MVAGRRDEAAARALAAARTFERKGNAVSAERARALVHALDAAASPDVITTAR